MAKASRHSLVTDQVLAALADYGKAVYDGTPSEGDAWEFNSQFAMLEPEEQARCLESLVRAVVPDGGWALYGAEELIGPHLESPGSGDLLRDELFAATLDFQRRGGVWWNALSPREHLFWSERHPDEQWLEPRQPPSRETAQITPLAVGEERKLTMLNRSRDTQAIYVARPEETRYVMQLDYPAEDGTRSREDNDEAADLYELYLRVARSMPFSGLWVEQEFEAFLPFPAPRL